MSPARTRSARLRLTALEDRTVPAWGAVPPASLPVPAAFTPVALNASGDAAGSAAITSSEIDWYRFSVATPGPVTLSALTPASNLDPVIGVYNSAGVRVAFSDDAAGLGLDSRTTVTLAAGTYFLGVTNYTGTAGGSYTWSVDAPAAVAAPTDDTFENNDTQATASNLGTLTAARTVSGLRMADAADWFRFTTAAAGTAAHSVRINFTNAQGNLDLQVYNSAGTLVRSAATTGNGETVSLSGLAAGTYFVRVFGRSGAFNPGYSLTVTPPPAPTPPPPPTAGGFQVTLRMTGLTASQQAIFQQAAARWSQVITGDLPDVVFNGAVIDDVLIEASARAIDGPFNILGQAGPTNLRSGTFLPFRGLMEFDSADLARLEADGQLFTVVLHEMAHVLGFGTIWDLRGLITGAGTGNPQFVGANAVREYNALFGLTATSIPVEGTGGPGTADGHWRESVFGREIMTGFLNTGSNPLSRMTIASFADLGYVVNYAAADAFSPTVAALSQSVSSPTGGTAFSVLGGGRGTGRR